MERVSSLFPRVFSAVASPHAVSVVAESGQASRLVKSSRTRRTVGRPRDVSATVGVPTGRLWLKWVARMPGSETFVAPSPPARALSALRRRPVPVVVRPPPRTRSSRPPAAPGAAHTRPR